MCGKLMYMLLRVNVSEVQHGVLSDEYFVCDLQVASHAQKYFIRLNSMNKKDKRRSSIHDRSASSLSMIPYINV